MRTWKPDIESLFPQGCRGSNPCLGVLINMKKSAHLRKSDLEKIAEKHPVLDSVEDLKEYNLTSLKEME